MRAIERVYRACRRRKRATVGACLYEQRLLDHLVETRDALAQQRWQPGPPVVFTIDKPKAREVYAAQYQDRVVHHWLVPQREAVIDGDFIHDAASNRTGKGTHFAVGRLQTFMRRQRGRGWLLQLDIANFFNRIHQPTLLALLANKLRKAVRRRGMPIDQARSCYRIARRIIRQPISTAAIQLCAAADYRRIPAHKRLENALPDTGLPIGNLTSQFFANLYLNELDQFVKHQLRCRHYVRYVDDFVLLHEDRAQLEHWHGEIDAFLHRHLRLTLKPRHTLAPLGNGADFLGYLVKPGHRLMRRRVVGNLRERLQGHASALLRPRYGGLLLDLPSQRRERLRATLASYRGHFAYADSYRLRQRLFRRFPWLGLLFHDAIHLRPRWQPISVTSMASQWRYFTEAYPDWFPILQCGRQLLLGAALPGATPYAGAARITAWCVPISRLGGIGAYLRCRGIRYLFCSEQGWLRGGMKRRVLRQLWLDPQTVESSTFDSSNPRSSIVRARRTS